MIRSGLKMAASGFENVITKRKHFSLKNTFDFYILILMQLNWVFNVVKHFYFKAVGFNGQKILKFSLNGF